MSGVGGRRFNWAPPSFADDASVASSSLLDLEAAREAQRRHDAEIADAQLAARLVLIERACNIALDGGGRKVIGDLTKQFAAIAMRLTAPTAAPTPQLPRPKQPAIPPEFSRLSLRDRARVDLKFDAGVRSVDLPPGVLTRPLLNFDRGVANSCFANSALQLLAHTPAFKARIDALTGDAKISHGIGVDVELVKLFREMYNVSRARGGKGHIELQPSRAVMRVMLSHPTLQRTIDQQNDSNEFLSAVIRELGDKSRNIDSVGPRELEKAEIPEIRDEKGSVVKPKLTGIILDTLVMPTSVVRHMQCEFKHVITRYPDEGEVMEPVASIKFDPDKETKTASLLAMFKRYLVHRGSEEFDSRCTFFETDTTGAFIREAKSTRPEDYAKHEARDEKTGRTFNRKTTYEYRYDNRAGPKTILISLSRSIRTAGQAQESRNNALVDVPIVLKGEMLPFRVALPDDRKDAQKQGFHHYDLCGIVRHDGDTPRSGHYTAVVKNQGRWYHYNDRHCTDLGGDISAYLQGKTPIPNGRNQDLRGEIVIVAYARRNDMTTIDPSRTS